MWGEGRTFKIDDIGVRLCADRKELAQGKESVSARGTFLGKRTGEYRMVSPSGSSSRDGRDSRLDINADRDTAITLKEPPAHVA